MQRTRKAGKRVYTMEITHTVRKNISAQLDSRACFLNKNIKSVKYQKYLMKDRFWVLSSETTWGCIPSLILLEKLRLFDNELTKLFN